MAISYGHWLGWLDLSDPQALEEAPVERATSELVRSWIAGVAYLSPTSRLNQAEQTLRVLAAHRPDVDWRGHRLLLIALRREVFETPKQRKQAKAGAVGQPATLTTTKRRRDGTMAALLALMPARRRSFCALELGRSVSVDATGGQVRLDGAETKSGTPWEALVPAALVDPLLRYLTDVRPLLLARTTADHAFVWVNDSGRPYGDIHLGDRIKRITRRLVGVSVSPHLFRDAAATTLAHTSPDAARLTRAILGHASFRIAERHYNHARTIDTADRYSKLVAALERPT